MRKSESETKDDPREYLRDLAALRRLVSERDSIERDSADWRELRKREDALTRKIRDWASWNDQGD
jgi:hypothetical protein